MSVSDFFEKLEDAFDSDVDDNDSVETSRNVRNSNNYTKGKSPDDWLFKSKKGDRPITRVQAYRIISRACEKAGIKTCLRFLAASIILSSNLYSLFDLVIILIGI